MSPFILPQDLKYYPKDIAHPPLGKTNEMNIQYSPYRITRTKTGVEFKFNIGW